MHMCAGCPDYTDFCLVSSPPAPSCCGCPNAGNGDINLDMVTNVLDAVLVVNIIIGVTDVMELEECGFEGGDLNTDGNLDVLDVVGIVNIITR
eukprot:scaffold1165_cov323-Prasinococcus_capsulatus_cf.AAC.3